MDEARCDFVQGMKYQRILEQTHRPREWPMSEGIAHDKQFFTVWNEDNKQAEILTKGGAEFVNQNVVVDGKIITANGPHAAEEFGKKVLEALNN